jgi:hypothetical protein
MSDDGRPTITFDYGQNGNLTSELLEDAQEVLAMSGKSQRALVERVRALHLNRGADSSFKQVLRIVLDFVCVYPLDFQEMVRVLGGTDQAVKFLPGCEPPPIVWVTIQRLREEGTPDSICQDYWRSILDLIENGEDNPWMYVACAQHWYYTARGVKPGKPYRRHSKEIVVRKSA